MHAHGLKYVNGKKIDAKRTERNVLLLVLIFPLIIYSSSIALFDELRFQTMCALLNVNVFYKVVPKVAAFHQ